jgi:Zn ribbon nucleic-acid-binding protein
MFYPVSTEKMHELTNEFTQGVRSLSKPGIWLAQLNKICQKFIDDYSLTIYEDTDVLQHIMYNTKPCMYQIILGTNKDREAHEIKRHDADNTFEFNVTLESVQDEFRQKFASSKKTSTPGKSQPVLLFTTTKKSRKSFPKKFKKDCSLCAKQGHKSVYCWNKPENAHKKPGVKRPDKALSVTTESSVTCRYCHKTGHTEQQCYKRRNQSANKDEKVNVMLLVTDHTILSKGLTSHFTPNTFIADSGATCHMRGSIEGMFNLKPHVTDIMVGNNETKSSVSKGNYRGLVMQKDGSSFEVILQDALNIPKLIVN